NFGESYWHRLHQVPGFEICPLHAAFIENSSIKVRQNASGKRIVSAECLSPIASPHFADSSLLCQILISIAKDIEYILEHPGIFLPSHVFYDQYRALLAERGFTTNGGMVRNVDFMNAF